MQEAPQMRTSDSPCVLPDVARVVLVRAGTTRDHEAGRLIGALDPPLSATGRAEVEARRRHWEWADAVWSSPAQRACDTARLLAPEADVRIDAALGPLDLGTWQGRTREELAAAEPIAFAEFERGLQAAPRGEPLEALRARLRQFIVRLAVTGPISPLVVSHARVIRELVWELSGSSLPEGRPAPAELVLLTRRSDGSLRLGRSSSDPEALRSPLERTGLSGSDFSDERHTGQLELRRRADFR
jgi:probable phosphoglycerate mutase